MLFFNILATITLLYWIWMSVESMRGLAAVESLPRDGRTPSQPPLVSIIIAAKEEERSITRTLRHLLQQDYERMEIIVINDRSKDQTGVKLEELKRWSAGKEEIKVPLQIIHVTALSEGWLGKNHALYQGYLQAKGEYLLFTDADVVYRSSTVRDAMSYMKRKEVDHLTVTPAIVAKSFWLRAFVQLFLFLFNLYVRPWRANDDHQYRHGIGIGAFNLIRRKAYEKIGTHQAFSMRPDDDLQLGTRVKQAKLKQRFITGMEHLEVEWYPDLRSAIQGLEKNTYSGLNYRLWMVIFALLGQFFAFLLPFIGIFLFDDWTRVTYFFTVLLMIGLYFLHLRKFSRDAGYEVIALPITLGLFCMFLFARST
jgi:cellulose synthase/poly-beta-1,6-N-acetylglucosamine synthase-like glycosyltransferase